ncbi:MAG: NTPase [Anaerolineae bacterium]
MGRALLLTGRPGIGKTTVIKAVAEALGPRAGGFYTEEIRGPGGRKGFRLVTLDGEEAVMAHVEFRGPRIPRVGRYGVDVEAIARVGVGAIQRAMREGRIVVVDEIGKMELFCGPFKEAVLQALGGPYTVLATVMAHPNPWADAIKAMPTVTLWEVTMENRDEMPQRVRQWIEQAARR